MSVRSLSLSWSFTRLERAPALILGMLFLSLVTFLSLGIGLVRMSRAGRILPAVAAAPAPVEAAPEPSVPVDVSALPPLEPASPALAAPAPLLSDDPSAAARLAEPADR